MTGPKGVNVRGECHFRTFPRAERTKHDFRCSVCCSVICQANFFICTCRCHCCHVVFAKSAKCRIWLHLAFNSPQRQILGGRLPAATVLTESTKNHSLLKSTMYVTSQIKLCSRFTGYPTRRPVHRLLRSRPVTYRLQV